VFLEFSLPFSLSDLADSLGRNEESLHSFRAAGRVGERHNQVPQPEVLAYGRAVGHVWTELLRRDIPRGDKSVIFY